MLVCGKCGSRNIYGHQGVVPDDGLTGYSWSCLKCGNTSESNKYGFKEDITMGKSTEKGTCGNCGQERLIIRTMNLCYLCQKHAQGKIGDDRVNALAEIREKILSGTVSIRKKREVEDKPRKTGDSGAKISSTRPAKAVKVEGNNSIVILPIVTDADRKLMEAVTKQAAMYRRTVEQQILWLCQNEISIHDHLRKEAEG